MYCDILKYKFKSERTIYLFTQVTEPVQETLQNVYTPFPLLAHIIFVVAAVAVFFIQFYRKGGIHYLLMAAATASTLITQMPGFSSSRTLIFILEIEEIVLCIGIIVFVILSAVKRKRNKLSDSASSQDKEQGLSEKSQLEYQEEKLKEIKRTEGDIAKDPVDNAFEKGDSDLDIYL